MDQTFELAEKMQGGVAVIAVAGEVDIATTPALRESLDAKLAAGHSTIVVDLLGVTFLDSTGIGALVGGMKRCRELGGELRLVVAEARILKLFSITGLTQTFSISRTVDEALAGVAHDAG